MTPLSWQPIPYQGSKRALAPRIARLFPQGVETLYEPFAGSAAMSVYAAQHQLATKFVIGDAYPELIGLWELIINSPRDISQRYRQLWQEQFSVGPEHFNRVRAEYNGDRRPEALLYLIARCVKNAVRFNRKGDFTQSADKRRTGMHPDKFEATSQKVSSLLKGKTRLICGDFVETIQEATNDDLVYMDPPYQGTSYGPDKRYAHQLEREKLIECLETLNKRQVKFILSYDGKTGDKEYGELLPKSLTMSHLYIHAGRSSQATLAGRQEETLESLYISETIVRELTELPDYLHPSTPPQQELQF